MYGYVYITTNLINGKQYIGQHKSSTFDENYKGSGIYLSRAINKYGWDNFKCKLIESCETRKDLNEAEIRHIKLNDAVKSDKFYNVASGGEGGDTFSGMSRENKNNFSSRMSDYWKNTSTYEERCLNISKALKGKCKSETHKKNLSESILRNGSNKGKNNGMYGKKRSGELAPNYGRHYYNNGEVEFLLYDDVYESSYKDMGFVKGRLQSKLDALHKDLSKRLKGNTYNRGKVRIHKDNLEKCVRPNELEAYLNAGWLKGRRPKQID